MKQRGFFLLALLAALALTACEDLLKDKTVAVTGITGVPASGAAGVDLTLTGTVEPPDATNKTILWSVKDAGATGASVTGNTLSTAAGGTVVVTATIANGTAVGTAYTRDFNIAILPLVTGTFQGAAYTLRPVPAGTVTTANTGSGNTTNWGAGNNPDYAKPYSVNAFYIGETEVTWELWKAVYDWATHTDRGANQYTFANPGRQGGSNESGPVGTNQHPVTEISWRDAVVWCNAYSEAAGRTPAYKYNGAVLRESEAGSVTAGNGKADQAVIDVSANGFRLPTEAQWEYAARGGVPGTGTPWTYTYAGSDTADGVAWYGANADGSTHAVKTRAANSLGLYDMSGNVFEWCQDIYSGADRVFRGGGWGLGADYCEVSYRYGGDPCVGHYGFGFRVACP